MISGRFGIFAAAALMLVTGCLPYSCRREPSTALLPADSVSRVVAASVRIDSLDLLWSVSGVAPQVLEHPRTVRFGPGASERLYVTDTESGRLFVFDAEGSPLAVHRTVDIPYLAGIQGDTVAVFDPETPSVHFLADGISIDTVVILDAGRTRASLVYGAVGDEIYYKRVDAEAESFVARVARDGTLQARWPLTGPHWRHAGLLRVWGDHVASLSGFRPVVDVVSPAGHVDTLALQGFDSPMFARTRSFVEGDIHEPPLVSSSAAPAGDLLFVLNMRAGWLHVDVFDRSGQLVRRLSERQPAYRRSFFPQDLDVLRLADGAYHLAVVLTQPAPELRLYRWQGASSQ